MADLRDMTDKEIEEGIKVSPRVPRDPTEAIAQATGIHIPAEEIEKSLEAVHSAVDTDLVEEDPVPVSVPGGIQVAQDPANVQPAGQVLDAVEMGFQQEDQKFAQMQQEKRNGMEEMFKQLEEDENARLERMEEKAKEMGISMEDHTVTQAERTRAIKESADPDIDDIDLSPGYTEDDMKETEESEVTDSSDIKVSDDPPTPDDREAFAEYIRGLPVSDINDLDKTEPAISITRAPKVTVVPNKGKKTQTLGDNAFMNAINRFKRDNFGRVSTALPNSGFLADVVGTGVVDLQNLYMNVRGDMTVYEYELEQMRAVIKNVVGTSPKIQPTTLASMVHYRDYESLSFAHVCATLDKVETVTNCSSCGAAFRIETDPRYLLLNEEELSVRRNQIMGASNVDEFSLMTKLRRIDTSVGIVVTLGHPSYAEYVRAVRGFQAQSERMTPSDARRFESMLDTLYFVRVMEMPAGIKSNNIYQNYLTMGLLSDVDIAVIDREVADMRKAILVPQYGIRETVCPHCGAVNKNIPFNNLLDLLFYHTTVSGYLNNPES